MTVKKIIANLFRRNPEAFTSFNAHSYAKEQKMVIGSIPLLDGTAAKILCDRSQYNVLIMKKGNVVTARGVQSTPEQTYDSLQSIYSHIKIRGRARKDFDIDKAWDQMVDSIHARTGVKPEDYNMCLYEW